MSGPGGFSNGRNRDDDDAKLKEFTWDEIKQHNTESDLWVVMYGRVYDLTEFTIDHPGGPDVLVDVAGEDASADFENILHTEKARKMAKKWLIGKVAGEELGDLFAQTDKTESHASVDSGKASTLNSMITVGFVVVAIAIAYKLYYN